MLKVATWNVNSVNVRLERLQALLARHSPDVLCLQELKCMNDKFPFEAVEACGYKAYVHGQKTYNGVALLAKTELANIQTTFEGCPSDDARFISAEFGKIRVASVYVPNGQEVGSAPYFYKLDWLHKLLLSLREDMAAGRDTLLLGDFNVAPENRDVHDPAAWAGKILCSDPERTAIQSLFDLGFVDVFRSLVSTAGNYSWWDYRALGFPKNHGLRIDLILASQKLSTQFRKSYIDREERKGTKPSDHAPVFAEFLE